MKLAMAWQRARREIGAPGLWGLGALAAAAALALGITPAWREAAQADRAALPMPGPALGVSADAEGVARAEPRAATMLPIGSDPSRHVADLLELALRHGVSVQRTDHRREPQPGGSLLRHSIAMPAKGSYRALREFVEAALRADPALALDGLRLRRAAADGQELDAELEWSLWSRADGAPTS